MSDHTVSPSAKERACRGCASWKVDPNPVFGPTEWGKCTAILGDPRGAHYRDLVGDTGACDPGDTEEVEQARRYVAERVAIGAVAADRECYGATLWTLPTFGCNAWRAALPVVKGPSGSV